MAFNKASRIGPDCLSHWMLYFKPTMRWLCGKFLYFGRDSEFRPGAYAVDCQNIHIGNRVVIRPGTMLFADRVIYIGDDVLIGAGVHIYTNNHKFDRKDIPISKQGYRDRNAVVLMRGCWVGANSVILAGVVIGENAVVGAGSVVTKSVPEGTVVYGNPARNRLEK